MDQMELYILFELDYGNEVKPPDGTRAQIMD